jgi:hypothetical protein
MGYMVGSGFGAVTQENISPLIGQQVVVNLTNGQTYGPASFTGFGKNSRGVTAVLRDALGNVREYNLADISSVVQTARTLVVQEPVYIGPWPSYAPSFYRGGRRHHHHHHGIGDYLTYKGLAPSTGAALASLIPLGVITLGVIGAAWLLGR